MSMFRLASSTEPWKRSVKILAYRGPSPPLFVDEEQGVFDRFVERHAGFTRPCLAQFSTLCEIEGNLKNAPRTEEH